MDGSSVRRPSVRLRPTLEGLEGKVLLSSVADWAAYVTTAAAAAAGRIALDGNVRGTIRRWPGATNGAEPQFVLAGKGQHATIGRARADGLARPSSVEALPSTTLTLKTSRGSVTLAMEALPETSARPALVYRYTVQSGTGAYLGATGSGTANLGLPRGLPSGAAGSRPFTLLLQSDRVRA